jgi:excisionase family DNA binding protein
MKPMPTEVMTISDVATFLKVNEKTIYRLVKAGRIPAFKVAGAWRFKKADIDEWIEEQKPAAQTNPKESAKATLAKKRTSP